MYLKRLEMQGFKSFMKKTVLDFDEGITSIIGPNGSGKSNIADAIRWVLGEQSAKMLRGGKMNDFIFAGTKYRKPVGFAEVNLVIDNTEQRLPIDYYEISIKRRLYRSGESEYMINNSQCRLKDIHELFLDTGIGKDGYSVIGQGRIDEILSTKSEDRRNVFEEASGIMKYKVKRIESERKLEKTEQNILRINDIIQELVNMIEPLKEQAGIAKRYLELRENLKNAEIRFFIYNIDRYNERMEIYNKKINDINEYILNEKDIIEKINIDNKEKNKTINSLKERLEKNRNDFHALEGSIEKLQSKINVNIEKISGYDLNVSRIEQEVIQIKNRISKIQEEKNNKNSNIESLLKQLKIFEKKLDEAQNEMDKILQSMSENQREIELLKSKMIEDMDLAYEKRSASGQVRLNIDSINEKLSTNEKEIFKSKLELDKNVLLIEDESKKLKKSENEKFNITEKYNEKIKLIKDNDIKIHDLETEYNEYKNKLHSFSSKHTVLKDMEENMDGYYKGVKETVKLKENKKSYKNKILGPLAKLIDADKKYEVAIETALGNSLQYIAVDNEGTAKDVIEYLRENKLGRVTFLPVTSIKPGGLNEKTKQTLKGCTGYEGIACDIIKYDKVISNIISRFLGNVVITDNLDNAVVIAKKFNYDFKIVTLNGDFINNNGSITGGSTNKSAPGFLSRRRILKELDKNIEKINMKITDTSEEIEKKQDENEKQKKESLEYGQKINDLNILCIRLKDSIETHKNNNKKTQANITRLESQKEKLLIDKNDNEKTAVGIEKEADEIQKRIDDAKIRIEEFQKIHNDETKAKDELLSDITDYKISVNSIKESIENSKQSIINYEEEYGSLKESIIIKQDEKDKNILEKQKLKEYNIELNKNIKEMKSDNEKRKRDMQEYGQKIASEEDELYNSINEINQANQNIITYKDKLSSIEVRREKHKVEMNQLQNRMWDEYEITYGKACEMNLKIKSVNEIKKEIKEFKDNISSLGEVNVNAIEEYSKTRERHDFLTMQRNDLIEAKNKLNKIIREMNMVMRKIFREKFELLNKYFNEVFIELFGGGQAMLELSDKDNILESGIEIIVQPPGKKLQNMMLLSGGEKAFTAIAILFSMLNINPTPFCIFDEIEAALDDVNVYKFADYLKQYSKKTQFIMITHRKGTMENSDILYGVTMQEYGISNILSMKIEDTKAV